MFMTYNPESDPVVETHPGIPSLQVMQDAVGGLIEPVMLWDDEEGSVDMYVNEEGLYMCEPTMVLMQEWGPQVIHGPVIFSRIRYRDGENVGLSFEDVKRVSRFLRGPEPRFAITSAGLLPVMEVVE